MTPEVVGQFHPQLRLPGAETRLPGPLPVPLGPSLRGAAASSSVYLKVMWEVAGVREVRLESVLECGLSFMLRAWRQRLECCSIQGSYDSCEELRLRSGL